MKRCYCLKRKKFIIYEYSFKIAEFVNYTKLQAESYATTNLIMTMGKAEKNIDYLIRYVK